MHAATEEIDKILSRPTCTVDQAAKVLGIGRAQAYKAVNEGEIRIVSIGARKLVLTSALRQLLELA
jgi:excisionase family DNA binding protein